jgi:hypothetical protein
MTGSPLNHERKTKMKKTLTLAVIGTLLGVAAPRSTMAQTNVTLDLDFYLTTVSQGTVSTNDGVIVSNVRFGFIDEATIISELGASTSNTFSRRAELLLVFPTNAPNDWTVLVRDGSNSVDVTGFFDHTNGTNTVGSTIFNPRTGGVTDTEYSIERFSLNDQPGFPPLTTHFTVRGLTITTTHGAVATPAGVFGVTDSITADVSGTGSSGGDLILLQGSVIAKAEFFPPSPVASAADNAR